MFLARLLTFVWDTKVAELCRRQRFENGRVEDIACFSWRDLARIPSLSEKALRKTQTAAIKWIVRTYSPSNILVLLNNDETDKKTNRWKYLHLDEAQGRGRLASCPLSNAPTRQADWRIGQNQLRVVRKR